MNHALIRQVNDLAEVILDRHATQDRLIVAIAGAPGSGKSTLAEELARRLQRSKLRAEVVPMDGFHLDNAILDARGQRARKGAPETFDAAGFVHMIRRMRAGEEVIAPLFDRSRDLAIAGAVVIPPDLQVVIVEGNYLMFDADPWRELAPLWDLSIRLDVPLPELRARLIQRWLDHKLSPTVARRRAEGNDIPNAQDVIAKALPCSITIRTHDGA